MNDNTSGWSSTNGTRCLKIENSICSISAKLYLSIKYLQFTKLHQQKNKHWSNNKFLLLKKTILVAFIFLTYLLLQITIFQEQIESILWIHLVNTLHHIISMCVQHQLSIYKSRQNLFYVSISWTHYIISLSGVHHQNLFKKADRIYFMNTSREYIISLVCVHHQISIFQEQIESILWIHLVNTLHHIISMCVQNQLSIYKSR